MGALDSRYTEGDLVFIETIFERILFEKVSLEVFVRYYMSIQHSARTQAMVANEDGNFNYFESWKSNLL